MEAHDNLGEFPLADMSNWSSSSNKGSDHDLGFTGTDGALSHSASDDHHLASIASSGDSNLSLVVFDSSDVDSS